MTWIYHITTPALWVAAQATGEVVSESLATEGFIHCSRHEQLLAVANRFFQDAGDLWVLGIDESGVATWLVYERPAASSDAFAHETFPHVYGPIPISAVVAAAPLAVGEDGIYFWPKELPRK